jgi:putative membrane protein
MTLRWLLAALHLLALGIGLGAVWTRSRALTGPLDRAGLARVLAADAWWGLAALLWIGTGVWRLLAGTEKATAYYMANHLFWGKMALLGLVLVLEVWPMLTLIGWRRRIARGATPDIAPAAALARLSLVQAGLILLMIVAATGMARGYGVAMRPGAQ